MPRTLGGNESQAHRKRHASFSSIIPLNISARSLFDRSFAAFSAPPWRHLQVRSGLQFDGSTQWCSHFLRTAIAPSPQQTEPPESLHHKHQILLQRRNLNSHAVTSIGDVVRSIQPAVPIGRRTTAVHHAGMHIYVKAGSTSRYRIPENVYISLIEKLIEKWVPIKTRC